MGSPMQNINISIATIALENMIGWGPIRLSGTMTWVVTSQANTPYNNPATILFLPSQLTLG